MRKNEIILLYNAAVAKLTKCGSVKVPRLFGLDGKTYTVTGLSFVYFYMNLRKIVLKIDLLKFLRLYGRCRNTMPNPRHFGMQNGMYFLVHGSYHPIKRCLLQPGEYCLYSIVRTHPRFIKCNAIDRRKTLNADTFERIKCNHCNRCGVCGSQEGELNFKNTTLVTKLEMGHCDPSKPLASKNCIPMCQYCNRVYKDKWVFNQRGIVVRQSRHKV